MKTLGATMQTNLKFVVITDKSTGLVLNVVALEALYVYSMAFYKL